MRTFERVAGLELVVDRLDLLGLEQANPSGFRRTTTEVLLRGGGLAGRGEDVTWSVSDQEAFRAAGPVDLRGRWTLAELSARLDELELWPTPPTQPGQAEYRRWAYESAALDLALAQAGRSLGEALGREPSPLRFVASPTLGRPPRASSLDALAERAPGGMPELKLDAGAEWTDALIDELRATGRVRVVDLKGHYVGTPVDLAADPDLYHRVAEGLPDAWIEDPLLDERTTPVLEAHAARLTWDAPIHTARDVRALRWRPGAINVKPSRSGRLADLFDLYDHGAAEGLPIYGGGQFELGCGRDQVQVLAALFCPEGPNDVAPRGYNAVPLPEELAASPLELELAPAGFGLARGT